MDLDQMKRIRNILLRENEVISLILPSEKRTAMYVKKGIGFKKVAKGCRELIVEIAERKHYSLHESAVWRIQLLIEQQTQAKEDDVIFPDNIIELSNGVFYTDRLVFEERPNFRLIPKFTLPVIYDPEAKCPKFDKFLEEILPDRIDRTLILQMFGYCLNTTDNSEQTAFFLLGVGANGKSALLDILEAVLGPKNVSHIIYARIVDNFHIQALRRMMVNIHPDLSWKGVEETAMLKCFISGDMVHVDVKGKDPIEFRSKVKFIFACNRLPNMYDDSAAFTRRWIQINFLQDFRGVRKVKNRVKCIVNDPDELSGIFNKAVQHLFGVRDYGFTVGERHKFRVMLRREVIQNGQG